MYALYLPSVIMMMALLLSWRCLIQYLLRNAWPASIEPLTFCSPSLILVASACKKKEKMFVNHLRPCLPAPFNPDKKFIMTSALGEQ